MKNLQHFNSFSINEAKSEVSAASNKAISSKLQDKIKVALALTDEIEKKRKAFEKSISEKEMVADKMVAEILDAMKKMGVSQIKMKDAIAEIQTTSGKTTYAYKDLCAYMLNEATVKQRAAWEAIMETVAFKTKHEDKEKLKLSKPVKESKVNEGLSDLVADVKAWAKKAWQSIVDIIDGFNDTVDTLVTVVKVASKEANKA